MNEATGTWDPLSLAEVTERLDPTGIDWWIAGGVAIDLFLGWESRSHDDLDIELFRSDRGALFDAFPGWELYTVSEGAFSPWDEGQPVAPSVFGVWGRPGPHEPWRFEAMLADGSDGRWRFRRDPSISLGRDQLTRTTPAGVTYCAPEVQLLYKAKRARPKDDVDLARCLHLLGPSQLRWLRDALGTTAPEHPWIGVLSEAL